jgi:hypothetical protein
MVLFRHSEWITAYMDTEVNNLSVRLGLPPSFRFLSSGDYLCFR